MISVHRSDLLRCARCTSGFPLTDIVRCKMSIMGESLCPACHERIHPACQNIQTLVREEDLKCLVCVKEMASIICPLCPSAHDDGHIGLLLCGKCCNDLHLVHKQFHSDHFYPPPKLTEYKPI